MITTRNQHSEGERFVSKSNEKKTKTKTKFVPFLLLNLTLKKKGYIKGGGRLQGREREMRNSYYIYLGIYACHVIIGLSLLTSRLDREPIRSRTPSLLYPSAFYGLLTVLMVSYFQEQIDAGNTDPLLICQVSIWNSIIFVPSWLSPHFLRAFILYHQLRWNQEKIDLTADLTRSRLQGHVAPSPQGLLEKERGELRALTRRLKRYRLFTSPWFNFAVFATIFVVNAGIGAGLLYGNRDAIPENFVRPADCFGWVLYLVIFHCVMVVVGMATCTVMLWKGQDGYFIKQEFTVYLVFLTLFVLAFLVIFSVPSLAGTVENPVLFASVFMLFSFSVYFPYALSFTRRFSRPAPPPLSPSSSELREREIAMEEVEDLSKMKEKDLFHRAMRDERLFQELKDFAASLFCVENILFLRAVEYYEEVTRQEDEEERNETKEAHENGQDKQEGKEQEDQNHKGEKQEEGERERRERERERERERMGGKVARRIKQEFLLPYTISEINIDGNVKDHLIDRIDRGDFAPDLFREAKGLVTSLVVYDTIPRWQQGLLADHSKKGRSLPEQQGANPRLDQFHAELVS